MQKIINFCLLVFALVFSTHSSSISNTRPNNYITIDIQPFAGIPEKETNYVYNKLKKIYPYVNLNKSIDLPQKAYYPPRKRYRADSLINYLDTKTLYRHITIGLTDKDISTTKDNIADWGVMGLGFCPGSACIVSTFRLSKKEKLEQLFKVAIHELGHTQGLPHCPVKICFMRDAEGKNPINEEKEFCKRCKVFLIDKGWKFE